VKVKSKHIAILALFLWGASLFLPTLKAVGSSPAFLGLNLLLNGWMALLLFNLAWLANPLFLFGIAQVLKNKPAFWPSLLALLNRQQRIELHQAAY
jgi:hypothetical protein